MIDNGSDKDFVGGGRRKSASGKNSGFTVCVKTFYPASKLGKTRRNSSDKCGGAC